MPLAVTHNWPKAAALMCVAVLLFSTLDATAKYLVIRVGVPVLQVVWLRFVFHTLLSVIVFGPRNVPDLIRSRRPALQWLRSLFMLGATVFNFMALKYLRLDQTVSIFLLAPLIVAILAGPILGEWVGWRRLLAICVGFLGVLLVVQPGFGTVHWAIAFSFGAVLSYALYNISTRLLADIDTPEVTQFFTPFAGLVALAPFALYNWQWPDGPGVWLLLFSLGVTGGFGHWLLILAHRLAPAPDIAPFIYTGLFWMSVLGFVVFSDVPDVLTLTGGGIVVASGLFLLYRDKMAERTRDQSAL